MRYVAPDHGVPAFARGAGDYFKEKGQNMGEYTECILGCRLKKDTPKDVIETLQFMFMDNKSCPPEYWPNENHPRGERCSWMLNSGGSYYFGAPSGSSKMVYNNITESYSLEARFNIKNYDNEIESFLTWLEPYVEQGSGERKMWAIVTVEDGEPVLYFKGLNEA